MNLLAVDIGNTHTVIGIIHDGSIKGQWRIETRATETPDEIAVKLDILVRYAGISIREIDDCIISSVVPPAQKMWKNFVKHYTGRRPLCVNEHIERIMDIRYSRPYEVGADRIVNAVAAWELCHKAVIVVDFGTAITFDCISDNREYLGGVIAPGPLLAAKSLASGTSKLPMVDLSPPDAEKTIAQDTVSAIKAGIIYGFAGLTDGIIKRIETNFPQSPELIATGGLSGVIIPFCDTINRIEPGLTLRGLDIIYHNYFMHEA
jgi:type III pantothenate kinase